MQIKNIYLGSLTSLAVMTSTLAYADQLVKVPSLEGGPTASIAAWYATPSAGNENYGFSGEEDDNHSSILNVTPGYEVGIDATIGYIFNKTANSIELLYRNHDSSDTDSAHGNLGTDETGQLEANLGYELNAFDLMIGQIILIGENMEMRFSGGLAYVELEQTQKTTFDEDEDDAVDELHESSEFTGWGPRVGIDARYDFGQGFGIVGGGSVAYYLGDLDVSRNFESAETRDPNDQPYTIDNDLDSQGVTNLRGNLGIDYVYYFDNEALSVVGLELGYQVDYYADVVGTTGSVSNPDIDTFATTFSGPYLNLKGAF